MKYKPKSEKSDMFHLVTRFCRNQSRILVFFKFRSTIDAQFALFVDIDDGFYAFNFFFKRKKEALKKKSKTKKTAPQNRIYKIQKWGQGSNQGTKNEEAGKNLGLQKQ